MLYVFGILSNLLFLFLSHVWCSGATTEAKAFQAADKVQGSSMPIVISIGFAVDIYFKDVETNIRWNHQTASFYCSTPTF